MKGNAFFHQPLIKLCTRQKWIHFPQQNRRENRINKHYLKPLAKIKRLCSNNFFSKMLGKSSKNILLPNGGEFYGDASHGLKKSKSMHFKGADLQQPGSYIQNFKPVPTVKKRPEKKICLEFPLRVKSFVPFLGMVKWQIPTGSILGIKKMSRIKNHMGVWNFQFEMDFPVIQQPPLSNNRNLCCFHKPTNPKIGLNNMELTRMGHGVVPLKTTRIARNGNRFELWKTSHAIWDVRGQVTK